MSADSLQSILAAAQARRDAGQWDTAALLFRQAELLAPEAAEIKHNLALVCFAKGDLTSSRSAAEAAIKIAPRLWQSHALLARLYRSAGLMGESEGAWRRVLDLNRGNGAALLGLADMAMNEFGDPDAALELVVGLRGDACYAGDAGLTELMATLYTGGRVAEAMSAGLTTYSRAHLRLPRLPERKPRAGRRRIGVISPLLSASPVYFFTWSSLHAIAGEHELVFFCRGNREDWATERLRGLAREWIEVPHVEPQALANRIAEAEIDVLLDLGGWSDVAGLAALSAKPAARMYKWVGGQSATTGLDMFDGWIGDRWQSPAHLQPLYAEPLVEMASGYIDYTPPANVTAYRDLPKNGTAVVGNPAKLNSAAMSRWPSGVDKVRLIDRRYVHERTRARVTELLERCSVQVADVIVPEGQDDFLKALGGCEAIVNTQPYAAGLTAVEALSLGVRVLAVDEVGELFCSRHHLSHLQTRGSNPSLPGQMLRLVSS